MCACAHAKMWMPRELFITCSRAPWHTACERTGCVMVEFTLLVFLLSSCSDKKSVRRKLLSNMTQHVPGNHMFASHFPIIFPRKEAL